MNKNLQNINMCFTKLSSIPLHDTMPQIAPIYMYSRLNIADTTNLKNKVVYVCFLLVCVWGGGGGGGGGI